MTPGGGWTRKAVLTAVAPWLAVAGLVALLAAFVALVIASALSFLGLVES